MIIVYKTPTCAYCVQVVKLLEHKKIEYQVLLAEGDEYIKLSQKYGFTVPLVYNDKTDKGLVGYNISELLKLI